MTYSIVARDDATGDLGVAVQSCMSSAHGSRSPRRATAVWIVKSAGVIPSSSSHASGNDTGTPGRTRGLYADTTVAPPTRVESTKTL